MALAACGILPGLATKAETVIVDGQGGGANRFANVTSALAALHRADGVPDQIRISAPRVREIQSLSLACQEGASDPLSIEGDGPGGATILEFGEHIGDFALDLMVTEQAQVTVKNLVLVPEFHAPADSALARDFPHGGVRIRLSKASLQPPGQTKAGVWLENVLVTSALAEGLAANGAQRLGLYQAHTRWTGSPRSGATAGFCIDGAQGEDQALPITLLRCRVAHGGGTGFSFQSGRRLTLELQECATCFGAGSGFVARDWAGALALHGCESSWNQGYGFLFASGGGSLELRDCRFTCNTERGLQIGEGAGSVIPEQVVVQGGSYSENGWTDYNLSSARKYEYGILVWGGSRTAVRIAGTPEQPVLFLANYCRALRLDNPQARLERIEHAVFAGRHQQSAIDLVNLDLSSNPVFSHCAFAGNTSQSYPHSQVTLSDSNSVPATMTFDDCTFYNVAGAGYHHVAIDSLGDSRTEQVTLRFNRCLFAGGPAGRGMDERALYLDGVNCAAEFRDCALVTEGPYALNAQYVESNLAGRGNRVSETNCIHADPNFAPSRWTLTAPKLLAARGDFLKPRASAYLAARTPGGVNIGGYNLAPAADAPPISPVRVAVYTDEGPEAIDIAQTIRVLQSCTDLTFDTIKAHDIWTGALERFDVILFPGGSSALEARSLKAKGRQQVQQFIQGGGGYVGTCAGAYLALPGSEGRLDLLAGRGVDLEHWARGHGLVQIQLTAVGQEVFGSRAEPMEIEYWQGPLMAPLNQGSDPRFQALATFVSDLHDKGAPPGVMPGTTAIAAGQQGRGRFIAFSPHPEAVITPRFNGELLYRAILWTANRKPVGALE